MKKHISTIISTICLIGGLATVVIGLVFLSMDDKVDKVDAGGEDMFVEVGKQGDTFTEYKHIETGCHYLFTDGINGDSTIQMFVDTGKSRPYCD